jgi:hypothetical protein
MGNEVSGPIHPEKNLTEMNKIQNVLDANTETFVSKGGDNVTSDAQYTITNANIPHYNEYMQAKQQYLLQKLKQNGGSNNFKVGDIVKRKSRSDEIEPCELIGKIVEVVESHEWPAGSGKQLPKMCIINFPELFKGTSNEGCKLAFPCCDLELVFDSTHH